MGLSNAKSFHPFCQIKRHLFGINKQSCKDKNVMLFCTKISPGLFTKQHSFEAQYVRGVYNTLAESLSRLQGDILNHLAPVYRGREPTDIPVHLQTQNVHL